MLSRWLSSKEFTCNAGDSSLIPGLGRSAAKGIGYPFHYPWASLVAQLVNNLPAMWETCPWVKKIPWRKERLPTPWTMWPMGLQRVIHDWATFTFTFHYAIYDWEMPNTYLFWASWNFLVFLVISPLLKTQIRIWKRMDTCICITEPLCFIPETNTTL